MVALHAGVDGERGYAARGAGTGGDQPVDAVVPDHATAADNLRNASGGSVRGIAEDAGDEVVDDVTRRRDAHGAPFARRAAGVEHAIALGQDIVREDVDAVDQVVVEAVVFDQVAGTIGNVGAHVEAPHIAVAHGDVLPVDRLDALGLRADARSQATQLEAVAIDGDVVGVDLDGAADGNGRAEVLAQAPGALAVDDGGYRIDEPGTRRMGLGLGGQGRKQQGAEQKRP